MKVKPWKISLLLIAIVIAAGAAWATYTLTNADAHFTSIYYLRLSKNVLENDKVTIEEHGMFENFSSSPDTSYIKAKDNHIFLAPSSTASLDTNWPHAKVTCNDSNYQFSHFTAVHCKHEESYILEKDDVENDPIILTQDAWNDPWYDNYNNFYACFSDKIISKADTASAKFGSVSPESAYFYMYKPAYQVLGGIDYVDGDYPVFCEDARRMEPLYTLSASAILPDGSCELSFINPGYTDYPEGNVKFKAIPNSSTCKFVKWKYEPTGNGTAVAEGDSGELVPGQDTTLTKEQLMTVTAYFDSVELPTPVVSPPTPINGLWFQDIMQTLVNPGTSTGGTMMYAIGLDEKTVLDADWTETPPQACNTGDYYIWYKVDGNEQWSDVAPTFACKVSISPTKPEPTPDPDPPSPDPNPNPSPDNNNTNEANEQSVSNWFANSSIPSLFGKDARTAPQTSDLLMFAVSILGLLFAVSVITAGIIKLRKKRH